VHVIVPGGIDDPLEPSGGNTYDRHACRGLAGAGQTVREYPVSGAWPRPGPADRAVLHRILAGLTDDSLVLIDGLVACGVPDIVVPHARRLRLAVLLHLPLGDEQGCPPDVAASLTDGEGRTLRAAASVVTTSDWAARRVIALHRLTPERVHVAAPGVEPAPAAPGTDGATRLLCVGALTPTKGQDLLVAALARLAHRPWTCLLVGPLRRDPSFVAGLRASIERHGLGGRVRLTGPLAGEAFEAMYRSADLLVLPSRAETFGMVITEALVRGIPVLAAAAGGVPDTLGGTPSRSCGGALNRAADHAADRGGVAGMLVPPDDVAALADGLRRWWDDAGLRADLRRCAARRGAALTGWEVTTQCLAQVLNGLPPTAR